MNLWSGGALCGHQERSEGYIIQVLVFQWCFMTLVEDAFLGVLGGNFTLPWGWGELNDAVFGIFSKSIDPP